MADPLSPLSDAVHVWAVPLAVGPDRLAALLALLSPEEQRRAARFTHIPAREQNIVSRAMLRVLLGRYLDIAPTAVHLVAGDNGKPALAGRELYYNLSHTKGLAVYAVTARGEVGVDVEQVRSYPSHLDLATRYFTAREASAIRAQAGRGSESAFFHVWTRKEAFLKALGLGLAGGLERFEVSVPPDDPARILHIDGDRRAAQRWTMVSLEPAAGYVATVAIETPGCPIQSRGLFLTGD
jgi:4'-phosphopantetheinyl transferase